jgi:5-methylcytosine-specific restriction protein A
VADFNRVPWVGDEVILALDLYFRFGVLDDADPRVVALSHLLRSMPIHPDAVRVQPRFRSPNSVALKLSNFLALDPGYPGVGMTAFSRTDEHLFRHYFDRQAELSATATAIREAAPDFPFAPVEAEIDEGFASEGLSRVLERQHLVRERNRALRSRKLRTVMAQAGRLACEVCGMDFAETYGSVGEGFIEVHHRLPLAKSGPRATRLSDLALACPNCHRMLHRDHALTVEGLRAALEERRRLP